MSSAGMAALEHMQQLLLTMLLMAAVACAGLAGLWAALYGVQAAISRRRRRRPRDLDARLHAEAERGIAELERYLGLPRDTAL